MMSNKRSLFLEYYSQGIKSPIQLQKKTKLSLSTVKRYLKKVRTKSGLKDKPKSGRSRVFHGKKRLSLIATIRHHRALSSEKIARKYNCCSRTVRSTLKNLNYKKVKPKNVFAMSAAHKNQRLEWANEQSNDMWSKTIFCDESFLQLQANTIRL